MSFLSYKIKAFGDNGCLYYEVGYLDKQKEWHPHVVSGPVFDEFDVANTAAINMSYKLASIYEKRRRIKNLRRLA